MFLTSLIAGAIMYDLLQFFYLLLLLAPLPSPAS